MGIYIPSTVVDLPNWMQSVTPAPEGMLGSFSATASRARRARWGPLGPSGPLSPNLGKDYSLHFCTHEGSSQHSVADIRVYCSILVTNCPWKICPHNANMQRPFFLQTSNVPFLAQGRPDGVRKYGKMRPKFGNIRPVWARPSQNVPASRKVKFYEVFCKRPSFTRSSGLLGFIELSPFPHQCWIWLEPHLKLLVHDWEAFNHLQIIAPNGPFQVAVNSH